MSKSKYTLVQEALQLGGRVVAVTDDFARSDFRAGSSCESRAPDERSSCIPLSKAHIRPFVEYRRGSSILKSHRGGVVEQVGGGLRGEIKGFSNSSRRRLFYMIGSLRRDAELPFFITLTYPEKFPEPAEAKRHINMFFRRLKRRFPRFGLIWKLEPQERGAPHFHILIWGLSEIDLFEFVPYAWFEIAGSNDKKHLKWHLGLLGHGNVPCVAAVRHWRGVRSYASKYLGKTFLVAGWSEKWTGRFWGVVNRDNVPFGELVSQEVTRKKAVEVMRYQKRFSGLKKRNNKSMTIFCDADQWVDKLEIGGLF